MTSLTPIAPGVHAIETSLRVAPGFYLPLRTTVLGLASGGLAIVSPQATSDEMADAIQELGPVEHVIAPNTFHHLFLEAAKDRWPEAQVHIPPALLKKRPGLRYDHFSPEALPPELQAQTLDGAPALAETVFLHAPSKTLVVTDLVFHVLQPEGLLTGLILRMVGAHRRLGQSRALRFATKDRAAAAESVRQILALDFERLVMAHGEIIESDAKARLEEALAWMLAGASPARLTAG